MNSSKNNISTLQEKGAVMLEAVIAFPFLLYVAFMGIELTRLSELQLARRDITRVISLTHICSFQQTNADNPSVDLGFGGVDSAEDCFQEAINQVMTFADNRFPDVQIFIQTFMYPDTDNRLGGSLTDCGAGPVAGVLVAESRKPSNFNARIGANMTITNDIQKQLCLNGFVTVAEFRLERRPLFSFLLEGLSLTAGSDRVVYHYEVGVV